MKRYHLRKNMFAYLRLRDAMGMPIKSKNILKNFIEYLSQQAGANYISSDLVMKWIFESRYSQSVPAQRGRFFLVQGFLLYLKAAFPDIEVPNRNLLAKPVRPHPFVFSTDALCKLLLAIQEVKGSASARLYTARTMFSLMACAGLRNGEVRKLTLSDLELDEVPPRLLVRNGKNNKSRLVPIHESAAKQLRNYVHWRQNNPLPLVSNCVFTSRSGKPITYGVLRRLFLAAVRKCNFKARPGQLPPSLHSLRHSFAVERLKEWHDQGEDVRALLPVLSIYLGHEHLSGTYWYLTSSPEVMNAASERFEYYSRKELGNGK